MAKPTQPTNAELERFVSMVPRGSDNAVTAAELCWRLGIVPRGVTPTDNHKRIVRNLRQYSQANGVSVLGDDGGYFVPVSMEDGEAAIGRREVMWRTIREGCENDRRVMREMFERESKQLALFS